MPRQINYYVRLALKNLARHRRRTLLTVLAVAVGLWAFILMDSLLAGVDRDSIRNVIDLETSDAQVSAAGYFSRRDELPLDKTLAAGTADSKLIKMIRSDARVKGVTSRIRFSAQLNNGMDEFPVVAVGLDPQRDREVFTLADYIVEGGKLQNGEYGASLGKKLAELMELKIGDSFTLVMRTAANTFQAIDLEVVGLVNSPHPMVNTGMVFLPLDVAANVLGLDGRVTEIDLRLGGKEAVDRVTKDLRSSLKSSGFNVDVSSWKDLSGSFLAISQGKRLYNGIFLGLVMVIAAVGIVNSVLLATIERTREIGTLKAIGMNEGDIVRLFLLESTGIGLLGGIVAVGLGIATNLYLVNVGIDLTSMIGDMEVGYPINGVIYGVWNWTTMVVAFLFGLAICPLVGWWPSRNAARKDPVEALRHA